MQHNSMSAHTRWWNHTFNHYRLQVSRSDRKRNTSADVFALQPGGNLGSIRSACMHASGILDNFESFIQPMYRCMYHVIRLRLQIKTMKFIDPLKNLSPMSDRHETLRNDYVGDDTRRVQFGVQTAQWGLAQQTSDSIFFVLAAEI